LIMVLLMRMMTEWGWMRIYMVCSDPHICLLDETETGFARQMPICLYTTLSPVRACSTVWAREFHEELVDRCVSS